MLKRIILLCIAINLIYTVEADFSLIVLGDTQYYSKSYPEIFNSQTQWVVNNKDALNIVFLTHVGDIVDVDDSSTQWVRANAAMSILDGNVPYGMGPGNHDQPTTLYNQYFPYIRYENEPWYGGHYQNKNDNSYQLFSADGMDFIIVHLENDPPSGAIDWADQIIKTYADRRAIVTSHEFLSSSGTRNSAGERIFNGLKNNPNLFLIICGHISREVYRTDLINGNPIHQLLVDYQSRDHGGDGWLKILTFTPEENKIYVKTYSTYLNKYETDADSQYTLDYEMTVLPPPPPSIDGDANTDGVVDLLDLILVAKNFEKTNFDSRADLNNDNQVNLLDLIFLAKNFGNTNN